MSTKDFIPTNKKTANLTPEQQRALLLKQLGKQERQTLSDFTTFGRIHNWSDFTKVSGLRPPPQSAAKEISVAAIREAFEIIRKEINDNTTSHTNTESSTDVLPTVLSQQKAGHTQSDHGDTQRRVVTPEERYPEDEFSVIPSLRSNPRVQYNKQQERAAADIVRRLMVHNHYAVGFPWPVGTGKTYVFAAVIAELYRRGWKVLQDSMALYPVVVVTRATIVEQTARVLRDEFGLQLGKQVDVTNIDQMRCKFGENFLKENIRNIDGIETVEYEWIPPLAPALIVLDEAQAVKNPDSTQSQIFQKFNELDGEDHRILFSSATLMTRVIETKVFAVATRLEW